MEPSQTLSKTPEIGESQKTLDSPKSPAPNSPQNDVDDSKIVALYANFCRIHGTPEELVIDFGFNPQPSEPSANPTVLPQRIVTSWYTAKRLLQVLHLTISRHESAFGVLETDIQKRLRNR